MTALPSTPARSGFRARATNIGRHERRARAIGGAAALAAAVASAAALIALHAAAPWRLAVFLPLWAGLVGLLQAREGT